MLNKKRYVFLLILLISSILFVLFAENNEQNNFDKEHVLKPQETKNLASRPAKQIATNVQPEPHIHSTHSSKCFAPLLSPITAITSTGESLEHRNTHKKYYELNTNLDDKSGAFTNELKQKIVLVLQHIENSFDLSLTHKLDLNIVSVSYTHLTLPTIYSV